MARTEEEKKQFSMEVVGIRMVREKEIPSLMPLTTPEAAVQVMADFLQDYDRELFCVVNCSGDMTPINMNIVSMGCLTECMVHPREVFKSAILSNAAYMMVFHQHPSGNLTPSKEDIMITDKLIQGSDLIGIKIMDHIIVGNEHEYYSFRENRKLPLPKFEYAKEVEQLNFEKPSVLDELKKSKQKAKRKAPAKKNTTRKQERAEAI